MSTKTYTGSGNIATDAAGWNGGTLPAMTDDAVIASAAQISGAVTYKSLTINNTFSLTPTGNFTINAPITFLASSGSPFVINTQSGTVNGSVTQNGGGGNGFTFFAGSLKIVGAVTNNSGGGHAVFAQGNGPNAILTILGNISSSGGADAVFLNGGQTILYTVNPAATTISGTSGSQGVSNNGGIWFGSDAETLSGSNTVGTRYVVPKQSEVTVGTTYWDSTLSGTAPVLPSFPANFSALGITAGGHIANVDTTTNQTNAPTGGAFTQAMINQLQGTLAKNIYGNLGAANFGRTLFIGDSICADTIHSLGQTINLPVVGCVGGFNGVWAQMFPFNNEAGLANFFEYTDPQVTTRVSGLSAYYFGQVAEVQIAGSVGPAGTDTWLVNRLVDCYIAESDIMGYSEAQMLHDGAQLGPNAITVRIIWYAHANSPADLQIQVISADQTLYPNGSGSVPASFVAGSNLGTSGTPNHFNTSSVSPQIQWVDVLLPAPANYDGTHSPRVAIRVPPGRTMTNNNVLIPLAVRFFLAGSNASPGFELASIANSGWTFENYLNSAFCSQANFTAFMQAIQSDTAYIALGQNDGSATEPQLAAFMVSLSASVRQANANTGIAIISNYPIVGGTVGALVSQASIAVAASDPRTIAIDTYNAAGNVTFVAQFLGDGIHPSAPTGQIWFAGVVETLRQAAVSYIGPTLGQIEVAVEGGMTSQGFTTGGVIGPVQLFNNTGQTTPVPTDINITINPVNAPQIGAFYVTVDIPPIAQSSAPLIPMGPFIDAAGNPIDLSTETVRMVVYSGAQPPGDCKPFDEIQTEKYQYQTGGSGITISGASNNVVNVQTTQQNNAAAGEFRYWLLRMNARVPLAWGRFPVRPATWGT